ncbi:MAG: DUF2085 domain-containing protein [Anaerolineales bacterium]
MDETPLQKRPSIWVYLIIAILLTIIGLSLAPSGLLGKADAIGYAVCHQIDERSFHMGDRTFPLCARCSGLFLGALLGMLFQIAQGRKGKMPPLPALILFGLMALAWAVDGLNSFTMLVPRLPSLYQTQNWTRLLTGTGLGLAVAAILWPSFLQTTFKVWEDQPALGTWKQIAALIAMAAVLDILLLLEIPWVLLPMAFLATGAVVGLLTMVYCMVIVLITKKENTYANFKPLMVPLIGGYILALLQIGGIDLLRYLLTGTWDGFSL